MNDAIDRARTAAASQLEGLSDAIKGFRKREAYDLAYPRPRSGLEPKIRRDMRLSAPSTLRGRVCGHAIKHADEILNGRATYRLWSHIWDQLEEDAIRPEGLLGA